VSGGFTGGSREEGRGRGQDRGQWRWSGAFGFQVPSCTFHVFCLVSCHWALAESLGFGFRFWKGWGSEPPIGPLLFEGKSGPECGKPQGSEVGGQTSEVRGPRSEVRGQRSEVRGRDERTGDRTGDRDRDRGRN
jgi:hypothetical protein